MLRPSDVPPKGRHLTDEGICQPLVMTVDQLTFNEDGSCVIMFHGIKNDYKRDGFEVVLQPCSEPRLDPVLTLKNYIERTKYIRTKPNAVFLSLKSPFQPLSARTVARILEKAIILAGLGKQGFTAKCFRPTGATSAVEAGLNPDYIRKVGRWKNQETFETHYVHSKPVVSFTDSIFQRQSTEKKEAE